MAKWSVGLDLLLITQGKCRPPFIGAKPKNDAKHHQSMQAIGVKLVESEEDAGWLLTNCIY